MAITTTAEIQDTIDTIHEKALLTSQHAAIMAGLSWNIRKGKGHSTVNVPYFSEVTASALTEGVDMTTSQTMVDTNVQITLGEVGCKIVLTETALEDDRENLENIAGKILGQALEKKRDVDLIGQLDDGTSTVGGTGQTLTMGHLAAGNAILDGNATTAGGPAPEPRAIILHPYQYLDIVDVVTPVLAAAGTTNVTGTAFTDEILRNYTVGQLFGIRVVKDGNIVIDATPDAKGGIMAIGEMGSLILATARDWEIRPDIDPSLRGVELNCVGRYGVGEYLAGWIVTVQSDAATPA